MKKYLVMSLSFLTIIALSACGEDDSEDEGIIVEVPVPNADDPATSEAPVTPTPDVSGSPSASASPTPSPSASPTPVCVPHGKKGKCHGSH